MSQQEYWGYHRFMVSERDCCDCERDEVCGCDCHFREQDPDLLYDAWRDKQDEEGQ